MAVGFEWVNPDGHTSMELSTGGELSAEEWKGEDYALLIVQNVGNSSTLESFITDCINLGYHVWDWRGVTGGVKAVLVDRASKDDALINPNSGCSTLFLNGALATNAMSMSEDAGRFSYVYDAVVLAWMGIGQSNTLTIRQGYSDCWAIVYNDWDGWLEF